MGNKENEINKEEKDMKTAIKELPQTRISHMANFRKIAQETIQKKGLTEEQVKKTLGLGKYEK